MISTKKENDISHYHHELYIFIDELNANAYQLSSIEGYHQLTII